LKVWIVAITVLKVNKRKKKKRRSRLRLEHRLWKWVPLIMKLPCGHLLWVWYALSVI